MIAKGHGFTDGNKRTAHAAMSIFLRLNGYELGSDWMDSEIALADNAMTRDEWFAWVEARIEPLETAL